MSGVQGLCVGFLSAIVVSLSRNDMEIGTVAAIGLRLAVCIGAYVDLDGISGIPSKEAACVALRWKDNISSDKKKVDALLQSFPEVSLQT